MKPLFLILAMVSLLVVLPSVAKSVDESLVLYFSFDEATGNTIKDLSGKGNTGTLKGDAKLTNEGKVGKGLSLSGNGYVEVPDSKTLDIDDAITLEAWIKPSTLAGMRSIMTKGGYTLEVNENYSLRIQNNQLVCYYRDEANAGWEHFQSSTSVPANEWTHIVFRLVFGDGNSAEMYFNGGKVPGSWRAGNGKKPLLHDEPFTIGSRVCGMGGESNFEGIIDEVVIYKRALEPKEIKKDMEEGIKLAVQASGKLATTWGKIKGIY